MKGEHRGDEHFGDRIEAQRDELLKFCRRLTKNVDDADDLAQEVMVTAYSRRNDFTPSRMGNPLRAWMFTIANNLFISGYRKQKVRPEFLSLDDEENTIVLIADDDVVQRLFLQAVMDYIRHEMPIIYSAPFVRFISGQKYADICEELDLPMGTVSTRLKRAREMVADWMNRESDGTKQAA